MKNYILVHGAWGGAWEFKEVVEQLSADGSKVIALDLPGHGRNPAPISEVTMESYVQTVISAVHQADEPVILVGHSLAGAVISQVAEQVPTKIERLIYVAAMLLETGDTPLEIMQSDKDGQLLPNAIFSEDQTSATLTAETVRDVLLHDVEDKERVDALIPNFLMTQSTHPFMAVTQLSEARFGTVPKYYIRASQDRVLSPTLQDRMLKNWPVKQVHTLDSGHFPLTSIPTQLVNVIRKSS